MRAHKFIFRERGKERASSVPMSEESVAGAATRGRCPQERILLVCHMANSFISLSLRPVLSFRSLSPGLDIFAFRHAAADAIVVLVCQVGWLAFHNIALATPLLAGCFLLSCQRFLFIHAFTLATILPIYPLSHRSRLIIATATGPAFAFFTRQSAAHAGERESAEHEYIYLQKESEESQPSSCRAYSFVLTACI